jgi:hypothetical protein
MKVLTQTHKALRGGLEAEAHALLLLLSDFHKSLPSVVSHLLNGGLDCEKLSERVNAGLPSQSVRCPKLQAAFGGALTAVENGSIPKAAPLPDLNAPGVLAGTRLLAARYSFKVLLEAANAVVACATNYQSASQSFNATLSACIDAMLRSMLFISLPDVISLARGHLPSVASVPSMASHVEHSIFEPGNADMGKFKALRNGEFNALLAKHLWWAVTYARLGSTTVLKRYESVLSTGIIRLVSTTALICAYTCVISYDCFCVQLACCSPEAPSTRREILSAVRTFMSSDLRPLFFPDITPYLDPRLLTGPLGASSHEGIKASAYSVLADLVYHARDSVRCFSSPLPACHTWCT